MRKTLLLLLVGTTLLSGCANSQREEMEFSLADQVDANATHLANHEERLTYIESLHVAPDTEVPEHDIYFTFNRYEIRSGEQAKIDELLTFLQDYPMFGIKLLGFADTVGTDRYNKHLAEQRNMAVLYALQQRGLPPGVIVQTAVGEAEGPDEIRNPENRRVEIQVYVHSRKPSHAAQLDW